MRSRRREECVSGRRGPSSSTNEPRKRHESCGREKRATFVSINKKAFRFLLTRTRRRLAQPHSVPATTDALPMESTDHGHRHVPPCTACRPKTSIGCAFFSSGPGVLFFFVGSGACAARPSLASRSAPKSRSTSDAIVSRVSSASNGRSGGKCFCPSSAIATAFTWRMDFVREPGAMFALVATPVAPQITARQFCSVLASA